MTTMNGIREYVTNGNKGTAGIYLGFSVCSAISVCYVFSLRPSLAQTIVKCGATVDGPEVFFLGLRRAGSTALLSRAATGAGGIGRRTAGPCRAAARYNMGLFPQSGALRHYQLQSSLLFHCRYMGITKANSQSASPKSDPLICKEDKS